MEIPTGPEAHGYHVVIPKSPVALCQAFVKVLPLDSSVGTGRKDEKVGTGRDACLAAGINNTDPKGGTMSELNVITAGAEASVAPEEAAAAEADPWGGGPAPSLASGRVSCSSS